MPLGTTRALYRLNVEANYGGNKIGCVRYWFSDNKCVDQGEKKLSIVVLRENKLKSEA